IKPPRPGGKPPADQEDAEVSLLAEALRRLHRDHDAAGALGLIAAYKVHFPHGDLAGEAVLIKAEALSRLGRRSELVESLDPRSTAQLPGATSLSLLRGEALAQLGRCREAVPAFTAVLGGSPEPELAERALLGRAHCLIAIGETTGARADLARLLSE